METGNKLGTNQPNVGDVGSNSGAIQPSVTAVGSNSGLDQRNIIEVGELYGYSLDGKWENLKRFYNDKNAYNLLIPLTAAKDTAFHLAVYSGSDDPIRHLLEVAKRNSVIGKPYKMKNAYGNTALHEAAANGNLEAAKLLVQYSRKLVEKKNNSDATPIFRAAAYGQTEVVKFLASQQGQLIGTKLKEIHYYKTTARGKADAIEGEKEEVRDASGREQKKVRDASILHAAIQGGHFDTALELLKLDESLATLEDKNRMTSLQLLATMPSAFKSGYRMNLCQRLFYFCLPIDGEYEEEVKNDSHRSRYLYLSKVLKAIKLSVVRFFLQGWPVLSKIVVDKRKHSLASKLSQFLIKRDTALWAQTIGYFFPVSSNEGLDEEQGISSNKELGEGIEISYDDEKQGNSSNEELDEERGIPILEEQDSRPLSLFLAAERGITEIVDEILQVSPQLVEHRNKLNQNILHVAIMHRQKEIFDRVKKMKIPMRRLVRGIDKNHYTILHHAANMNSDTGEIHRGPVYHLQDELKWFKRVEKITPSHFAMLRVTEKDESKKDATCTCKELFKVTHKSLLKDAQKWIKETSQSCSAVAVLVATVVFAAAYTVPGGSDENGLPVFLNSSLFLVFTVMDIVALAFSLTSVVMFLSVLTSPFKFENFRDSLPKKLTMGFTLLFLSLTTTMLAFTATILLIIRLEKPRWTTTLIYTASFLPVSIFALTQFPMFLSFTVTLSNSFKMIKKGLPFKALTSRLCAIRCPSSKKNE